MVQELFYPTSASKVKTALDYFFLEREGYFAALCTADLADQTGGATVY